MQLSVKKTAFCGLTLALSLIAGYAESLIPLTVAIPGIKLGAGNSVIVFLLYMVGTKEALLVNLCRVFLSGFFFGNMTAILYSLSGALLSLLAMVLIKKTDRFSIGGVSMAGGVFHNIGQLLVAYFILKTGAVLYYLPVLVVSGTITGLGIGWLAGEICKRIKKADGESSID